MGWGREPTRWRESSCWDTPASSGPSHSTRPSTTRCWPAAITISRSTAGRWWPRSAGSYARQPELRSSMTNRWRESSRLSHQYANDRHDPRRGNHPKEGSRFAAPAERTDTRGAESSARPRATSGKYVRVVPVETGVREPELMGEDPADRDRRPGLV